MFAIHLLLSLTAVHTQAPITLYQAYFSNHRTELGLALVRPSTACSPCCSQRNCNTPDMITSFPCFWTLTHNQLLSQLMGALRSLASTHHSASSLPLQWPCQTLNVQRIEHVLLGSALSFLLFPLPRMSSPAHAN